MASKPRGLRTACASSPLVNDRKVFVGYKNIGREGRENSCQREQSQVRLGFVERSRDCILWKAIFRRSNRSDFGLCARDL